MESCIEWNGALNEKGYGKVRYGGKTRRAHRVAWEKSNGKIPDGMLVCHSCDNPSCINVAHLWLGTAAQNTHDMIAKGRMKVKGAPKGEKHPRAKLTDAQVKEIKQTSGTHVSIAAKYGINPDTIGNIKRGTKWKTI